MTKFLAHLADGFITIVDSYESRRDYVRPVRDGFARDSAALRGDVARVGKDMRKAVAAQYGKQPNKNSGR